MAKRGDWEYNHYRLQQIYTAFLEQKQRRPTIRELATLSGLHRRTIEDHIKSLKFKPRNSVARVLTDKVIDAIGSSAIGGNVRAQELWMKVMEDWNGKSGLEDWNDEPTEVIITIIDKGEV